MEKVDFTLNDGRVRRIGKPIAVVLAKRGRGTYQTRDMARQPVLTKPMQAEPAAVSDADAVEQLVESSGAEVVTDDGLDSMDKDQLHALAKDRNVKVHHMAGADKVRAALREAA